MTHEQLIETPCTLNGQPAKITGRLHKFAEVRTRDGLLHGTWSWPAAERIITQHKGQFQL